MYNLTNSSFSKIQNFQIGIKLESNLKLPCLRQVQTNILNPLHEAYNLGLNFNCFTFKKKNKILLTTLTSPHVHKKSREQYKIDYYRIYFVFNIKTWQDYKKFLQLKLKLYQYYLDQGLSITFTYNKTFSVQGFLPYF